MKFKKTIITILCLASTTVYTMNSERIDLRTMYSEFNNDGKILVDGIRKLNINMVIQRISWIINPYSMKKTIQHNKSVYVIPKAIEANIGKNKALFLNAAYTAQKQYEEMMDIERQKTSPTAIQKMRTEKNWQIALGWAIVIGTFLFPINTTRDTESVIKALPVMLGSSMILNATNTKENYVQNYQDRSKAAHDIFIVIDSFNKNHYQS